MASVNYLKCKSTGHAKAMMRHSEKEERLKHDHSNPDIDKSCTEKNSSLYGLSYDEMCRKYDDRIRLLDETTNTNKRSDRVTMFSLSYSVPEGLPEWLEENFIEDVEKIIADQYGEKNIIESERHLDEKHKYIDHGEEKMSRAHGHTFVIPEIDGKLNGKKFSSKSQMKKLNKAIEVMSLKKYHVRFMTGEQAKHKTVEMLKNESFIESQERKITQNNDVLTRQLNENRILEDRKNNYESALESLQETYDNKTQELSAQYQAERERLTQEYEKKVKEIAAREKELSQREKANEGRELKLEELKELEQKSIWSNKDKQNILKTAKSSVRNAEKAKNATYNKNYVEKENKALEKENKALRKQMPTTQEMLHYNALEDRVNDLTLENESLRKDIKIRDKFIKDRGLSKTFTEFCQKLGHTLKVAIENIKKDDKETR